MNELSMALPGNQPLCSLCGPQGRAKSRFVRNGYHIYRCSTCGLLFVYPQPLPEEIVALYEADYFKRGNKYSCDEGNRELDPNRQNDLVKISVLERYRSKGRLLDVGCGMGGFLEVGRKKGYDVSGVEVSEFAAGYIANELGIEVANSGLPEAGLPSQGYDLVTMWDVIEHLDDPSMTLQEIHRILRPTGLLVLSTGNAGSLWARVTGRFWQLLTPPQHLFFFDEKSLRKALESSGFVVKEMLYLGKRSTLDFILFKARETLGPVVSPLRAIVTCLGLNKALVSLNLYDIVTCVAEKT